MQCWGSITPCQMHLVCAALLVIGVCLVLHSECICLAAHGECMVHCWVSPLIPTCRTPRCWHALLGMHCLTLLTFHISFGLICHQTFTVRPPWLQTSQAALSAVFLHTAFFLHIWHAYPHACMSACVTMQRFVTPCAAMCHHVIGMCRAYQG